MDDKNLIDANQIAEFKDKEQRNKRKKRRVRNQILVYITLICICTLIGGGTYFAISFLPEREVEDAITTDEISDKLEELDEQLAEQTDTPEVEETPAELTPEEKLDEIIEAAIETMTLEDRVAGLFIVSTEGLTGFSGVTKAGETTQDLLIQYPVGGMIYFEENIKDADQFSEMVANTVAFSKYPLFLSIDEEGGEISRLAAAELIDDIDSAYDIGQTADPANAYNVGASIATSMTSFGLNLNFAPVADLNMLDENSMGDRIYGSDPTVVGSMVSSMVTGLEDNGISSCLKHFPGIGSTVEDTHDEMAVSDRTLEQFMENEFVVFEQGITAGADFVMVGHMSAPGISGNNTPSSLSEGIVTDILREQLEFKGVIISDSLSMTAITEYYTSDQAAVLALKAGCDMILMPNDFEKAYNGVLEAVGNGTISEERINDSLKRIYRIKYAELLEQ